MAKHTVCSAAVQYMYNVPIKAALSLFLANWGQKNSTTNLPTQTCDKLSSHKAVVAKMLQQSFFLLSHPVGTEQHDESSGAEFVSS